MWSTARARARVWSRASARSLLLGLHAGQQGASRPARLRSSTETRLRGTSYCTFLHCIYVPSWFALRPTFLHCIHTTVPHRFLHSPLSHTRIYPGIHPYSPAYYHSHFLTQHPISLTILPLSQVPPPSQVPLPSSSASALPRVLVLMLVTICCSSFPELRRSMYL